MASVTACTTGSCSARNTWVYHQALAALTSKDQCAFYTFEDSMLDLDLIWHGAEPWGAEDQFAMPTWPLRVKAALRTLRGEDSAFIEHLRTSYNRDFERWIDAGPPILREDPLAIARGLWNALYSLGAETLDWFAWNPILDIR